LAKRFDFDGNGVLDADERQVGKRVLADEFFTRHKNDLHIFGPQIAANTHKKNVDNLVNSYRFVSFIVESQVYCSVKHYCVPFFLLVRASSNHFRFVTLLYYA
jgi:hypothetical protein